MGGRKSGKNGRDWVEKKGKPKTGETPPNSRGSNWTGIPYHRSNIYSSPRIEEIPTPTDLNLYTKQLISSASGSPLPNSELRIKSTHAIIARELHDFSDSYHEKMMRVIKIAEHSAKMQELFGQERSIYVMVMLARTYRQIQKRNSNQTSIE